MINYYSFIILNISSIETIFSLGFPIFVPLPHSTPSIFSQFANETGRDSVRELANQIVCYWYTMHVVKLFSLFSVTRNCQRSLLPDVDESTPSKTKIRLQHEVMQVCLSVSPMCFYCSITISTLVTWVTVVATT